MKVLVHLGLNKCASTYVQHALDGARHALARAGTWYPEQEGPPAQYGLSQALGFGPDAAEVTQQSVDGLVAQARRSGCVRMIISSEYFSLYRPQAATRLVQALDDNGCAARYVMLSRNILDWIRSLFNQYVRTVEVGRELPDIDAYVDQALENGALDIAARYCLWVELVGRDRLRHYRLHDSGSKSHVLGLFSHFAGAAIAPPPRDASNASVPADALFRIGQLRAADRTHAEELELQELLSGRPTLAAAPQGYMTISSERLRRLRNSVVSAYEALPVDTLPGHFTNRAAA